MKNAIRMEVKHSSFLILHSSFKYNFEVYAVFFPYCRTYDIETNLLSF